MSLIFIPKWMIDAYDRILIQIGTWNYLHPRLINPFPHGMFWIKGIYDLASSEHYSLSSLNTCKVVIHKKIITQLIRYKCSFFKHLSTTLVPNYICHPNLRVSHPRLYWRKNLCPPPPSPQTKFTRTHVLGSQQACLESKWRSVLQEIYFESSGCKKIFFQKCWWSHVWIL